MNKYSVTFEGRQNGAQGKFERLSVAVTAESIFADAIIPALNAAGYEVNHLVCRTILEYEIAEAYWDRFDICEGWYLALTHCHGGQSSPEYARLCKLTRAGFFQPSPFMTVDSLNENARAIYDNACATMGCPS